VLVTCGSKQRRDGKCGTGDGDLRVARDGIEQNLKDGDSHAAAEREYDGQNPVDKCPVDDEIDVEEPVAEYGDAGGNREAQHGRDHECGCDSGVSPIPRSP
jgi:hypothetical protein